MRRRLLLSFIFYLLLTGCGKTGCDSEYFQAVSTIEFPEDTQIIDCYDNLEWAVEAIFQLPDTSIEEFIRENEFQEIEEKQSTDSPPFFLLPEKSRPIYDKGELFSLAGSYGSTN